MQHKRSELIDRSMTDLVQRSTCRGASIPHSDRQHYLCFDRTNASLRASVRALQDKGLRVDSRLQKLINTKGPHTPRQMVPGEAQDDVADRECLGPPEAVIDGSPLGRVTLLGSRAARARLPPVVDSEYQKLLTVAPEHSLTADSTMIATSSTNDGLSVKAASLVAASNSRVAVVALGRARPQESPIRP